MSDLMGVAISTTGDEHRLNLLRSCVEHWRMALPLGSVIVVTVDGSEEDAQRARDTTDSAGPRGHVGGNTYRVGQPPRVQHPPFNGRMGGATNKNTGLELLMGASVEHLFLCDDDTWPLFPVSLTQHTTSHLLHSMVCWGKGRLDYTQKSYAAWKWPRGVMLYTERAAVEKVGGMDERFGIGGHEHAEWSRRIHQHGLTPEPFVTPMRYALDSPLGKAHGGSVLWHCEDMPRLGESSGSLGSRRRRLTSVRKEHRDWEQIEKVMQSRDGDTTFVPYAAAENGRSSATLIRNTSEPSGQGAEETQ